MSKLSYATIGEAFILGSDQIKNTQDEIAKLKSLVLQTSLTPPKTESKSEIKTEPKVQYERIGQPDITTATFIKKEPVPEEDDFEKMLLKLIKNPKFDDIVKNYMNIKYPELNSLDLTETKYEPSETLNFIKKETFGSRKETFGGNKILRKGVTKESFGAVCSVLSNIIIFLMVTVILYMLCSLIIDNGM
jgi:hypothetical protein